MVPNTAKRYAINLVAATALGVALAGCSGAGFVSTRTEGYVISDSALQQIRPGQSVDLVVAVLGSPQTTNTFGEETAYYYVETKIEQTAFGLKIPKERRVLAIYFDKAHRVSDKALYGLADGRVVAFESRRTPSYGQDRTFVESILASI